MAVSSLNAAGDRKGALEEAEEKVRDLGAADRGLSKGLHETKVREIANVGAASVGECQTVTPEEPLKVYHRYRYHRQHDERQGGLAPSESGVEEADARDHEKHQGGRGEDPGEVTTLSIGCMLAQALDIIFG